MGYEAYSAFPACWIFFFRVCKCYDSNLSELELTIILPQEKSHRGWVFHYKQAEVIPSSDGGYVLKVKGNGWFDVLLQVAKQEDLQIWCTRLNIAARRQKHDLETMEWQSAKTSAFHDSTQSSHLSSGEAQLPLEELLNLEHEHKRRLQNTSDL